METLEIWQRVTRPSGTVRVPGASKGGDQRRKRIRRYPLHLDQHQVGKAGNERSNDWFPCGGKHKRCAVMRFKILFSLQEARMRNRISCLPIREASVHYRR